MERVRASLTSICDTELARIRAEVLILAGRPKDVFSVVEETLAVTRPGKQGHYESDLFRLEAEAALALGDRAGAMSLYRIAIDGARQTGARTLELRATMGLAKLVGGAPAQTELRAVLDGFTEGLSRPEVRAARELARS